MATYPNSTLPLIVLAFALLAILASAMIPVMVKQAKDEKGVGVPLPSIIPSLSPNPLPSISETGVKKEVKKEVKKTGTSDYKKSEKGEFMWQYPESTIVSDDGETIKLQSSDNTQSVTNWYREKIASLGFAATTFSQTSVNNSVNNVLAAASEKEEVRVEIIRSNESTTTQVRVLIRNK